MKSATEHDDEPMDCDECGRAFTAGELEHVYQVGDVCPECLPGALVESDSRVRNPR